MGMYSKAASFLCLFLVKGLALNSSDYSPVLGGYYLYFVVHHELNPSQKLIRLPKQFCTHLYSRESRVERVTLRLDCFSQEHLPSDIGPTQT